MVVLVNSVTVGVLWLLGGFLSKWLMLGTGGLYSAATIFSWWLVTYFTKQISVNALNIVATYAVMLAFVMSAHYSGHFVLFANVPVLVSANEWVSFAALAFVMTTPLLFNGIVRTVGKTASQIVN